MTVQEEKEKARKIYGSFNSTHEVYGVMIEEVQEFFDLVRINIDDTHYTRERKSIDMISELTQISSVCQRAIEELENDMIKWV
jgi:hypothetical protein